MCLIPRDVEKEGKRKGAKEEGKAGGRGERGVRREERKEEGKEGGKTGGGGIVRGSLGRERTANERREIVSDVLCYDYYCSAT